MNDGSTCVAVFHRGNKLLCANVGDSRGIVARRGGVAVPISFDHKPNRPEERRRIQAAGGRVVNCFGVPRVNGVLAVSRAFGDRHLTPVVRADPEIIEHDLRPGDEYVVLGSDGLWDVLSNDEVADLTCRSADRLGCQGAAQLLTTSSSRKGSMDNTTALVIDVRPMVAMFYGGGAPE